MLAARTGDGRFGPFRFVVGSQPGQWRPVLPAFVNDPNAWVARVRPFLIDRPARFRSDGPNALDRKRYAREFAESSQSARWTRPHGPRTRPTWPASGPSTHWRCGAASSASCPPTIASAARRTSLLRDAVPDRGGRRHQLLGRQGALGFLAPDHGDPGGRTDGNPATDADPGWLPLLATPPYPDHPSGHGCVSSSIVESLRDFFGTDRAAFSATSVTSGTTRSFTRFSQAIEEIIDARVHFRSADVQGARLGGRWPLPRAPLLRPKQR